MELTAAQLEKLPPIRSKAHVSELLALHIHANLPGNPATVETSEGHFRLSRELSKLAAKAYAHFREGTATRPRKGRLGAVLAAMAGVELEPSEAASEEFEESAADPLEGLAKDLAREAMGRLEGLFQDAVAKELGRQKEALFANALRKSLARQGSST